MRRLCIWLADRARAHFSIRPNDQPYIERYYLGTLFGVGIFLHQYLAADGDRHLHNHPWTWSMGIPLVGGYLEERLVHLCPIYGPRVTMRTIWRFRPNLILATAFHRIAHVRHGTWTLFVHGRRLGGWGFLQWQGTAAVFEQTDPTILSYTIRKLETLDR